MANESDERGMRGIWKLKEESERKSERTCTVMVQGLLLNVHLKINRLDFLDLYFSGVLGAFGKTRIIRADAVPVITMTRKIRT